MCKSNRTSCFYLPASACFSLSSSPIAKGEKERCTWKRMDPCLHIMSARIRMKHVWTWQDLSKGFDSQVGTLCIGTAVVIPAPAPSSSPQRIPPLLQGCLGQSQSSWTATVYNQTSQSGTLLLSHRPYSVTRGTGPSLVSHLQLVNIPLRLPVDTAIPVTLWCWMDGPPEKVRSSMRNYAEVSWYNSQWNMRL